MKNITANNQERLKSDKSRAAAIVFCFMIVWMVINLFPVINMLINSFRLHPNIIAKPIALDVFTLDNYAKAIKHTNIFTGMFNGVFISFCTIIVLACVGSMNAYALTFIGNRFGKAVETYITIGYFIPPAALLINGFLTLKQFGLINSYTGIVLIYAALYTPITMIIITGYMKTIPNALIESARMDGANHFRTFAAIILPLTRSALVTVAILLFMWTYGDYMWPLILMARPAKRTIAVALSMFVSDRQDDLGIMSAAVIATLIPILVTYIIMKEKIMAGMTAGAVKG